VNTSIADNSPLKDEQWAIKSFRPLLKDLHVQDIPSPPEFTLLYIADYRHLVIQGLVKRLKGIFSAKSHALLYADIQKVAEELTDTLLGKLQKTMKKKHEPYFDDAHFRLGFEDFPISYPVFFQDLLFSRELFEEYFTKENIEHCCIMIYENNSVSLGRLINTICQKIVNDKALNMEFVLSKVIDNIIPHYVKYKKNILSKKV
jgi:hypothetical protein